MMKTKVEILHSALKSQQRYLSFLGTFSTRVILGIGITISALVVVASHLSRPGALPLIGLILTGILGGLMAAVILGGVIWLLRILVRSQIASYQEAIEKLEREE